MQLEYFTVLTGVSWPYGRCKHCEGRGTAGRAHGAGTR